MSYKILEYHINLASLNVSCINFRFCFFSKSITEFALKVSKFHYCNLEQMDFLSMESLIELDFVEKDYW